MKIDEMLEKGVSYEAFIISTERRSRAENRNDSDTENRLSSNLETMEEILKGTTIPFGLYNRLCEIDTKMHWLVISEPWCIDTANVLPILYKLSEVNDQIELQIVFRDEHPDIMDQFLTNGKRAIPKLICFNHQCQKLGEWGPRVVELQSYIDRVKTNIPNSSTGLKQRISSWYQTDRASAIFNELEEVISKWIKEDEMG